MSNITLNIVEPASPTPTPIDPGTGTVVPDTGLFTSGIGGAEAAIIATLGLVAILAIVGAIIYYRKHKQGKVSNILAKCKQTLKTKKHAPGLAMLALLVSIGTVAGLLKLGASAEEADSIEAQDSTALTIIAESADLTIELGDEPVFAVLPVELTVAEATKAGYTLTAYTENTDLVSTTDSSKVIPMVVADEGELTTLTDNTYGLALVEPEAKDEEVYTALSTDSLNPTIIKSMTEYTPTAENDTTTIYYGFYITPDTPYGTYVGSDISVDAIPNIATVTFDANGLYFNDSEEATENTVGYKPVVAEAPIEEVEGEYLTPAPLAPVDPSTTIHYTFLGWSEDENATEATYENEEDILANLTLTKNESLTLYAVWHYNTVLSFNGNTSDGGTSLPEQTIAAGATITLPQNTYTKTGSVFIGWNTVATPTSENPGTAYSDQASFTAPDTSADITLYAQWAYTTTITFNGNGATSGSMSPQTIVAGTPENLTQNAFTKTNATFIGWNTQANGSGTSYSDEAEFTASTTEHQDITLYAQWAYTTISFNGNTSDSGTMNSVTIAGGATSNLPANTYTKNNCIFTGWNTVANGTGTSYGNSSPYQANATTIEAFTLYAQWQCISQVNYYGNGATSGEMASSIILGGSTHTFPQNTYARDNYTFIGWNTVANPTPENPGTSYSDQGSFTAPMTPATTLDLYAQWAATTITFNGNGADGGSMSTATIAAGTSANLPTNGFTKTNCIFTGWNTASDDSGTSYSNEAEYSAVAGVNASVTLYAQWLYTSTINFNGNGADGGTMNSITAIGGESTTLPQNEYTKTNATFIGWNTQANGTGTPYSDQSEFVASTTQHDDITLYAQWASTTITFNGNGADSGSMSTATIAAGTSANLPQNAFTKTGYAFAGWNTVANPTPENPGTSYSNEAQYFAVAGVSISTTLYAQWAYYTTVTFNGNGETSGSMSDQVIVAGTPQNLTPNAYTKEGYIFTGWNTVQTPTTENPGTVYADKAQYAASTTQPESITLYAQWMQPTMQNVALWGSSLSQGDTMQVPDTRDGKSYWVAKLADGNIWMTQNLDLDIEADKTYTSADTDLANSTIGTTWTPTVSTGTTSSWTSSTTAPSSYDPGDLYWNGNIFRDGELSNSTVSDPSATSGGTHYHIGNYYNWTAAIAMSDSSSYTTDQQDVNQSICPAGWRLPTYSGDKSYDSLASAQGLTSGERGNIQKAPTYFVYGGYWSGSSSGVSSQGEYWSSVGKNGNTAIWLYFERLGTLYTQSFSYRGTGISLRCVAR